MAHHNESKPKYNIKKCGEKYCLYNSSGKKISSHSTRKLAMIRKNKK